MGKIYEITPEYCDNIPNRELMKDGVLYIKKGETAIHLCACGCGSEVVTKLLPPDNWTLNDNNGLVTLRPSIGNFKGEKPYHAHYYITENKIVWCK